MFTPGGQLDKRNLAVFGGKGGGGTTYVPPVQPMMPPTVLTDPVSGKSFTQVNDPRLEGYGVGRSAADMLNEEIDQRKQGEKADSDKLAATTAQKKADDLAKFQGTKQTAFNDALNNIQGAFRRQGVDPTTYNDQIMTELNRRNNSIADMDPNPASAFPGTLGDSIIADALSGKRTTTLNSFNSIFKPNYSNEALPDSLTGDYVNTLLDEQFNPLSAQLTNAQKRGTLTDVGYKSALDTLGQRRTAGASTIQNLGQGILAGDRKNLDDYITGARSDVNSMSLGSNIDPASYGAAAQGKITTDKSSFGGALRNAVGETKFADITDLLNAGGAVQGSNNPSATNPNGGAAGNLSPSFVSEEELAKRGRGLGSSGAF
jgi:hypothetical protein